MVLAGLSVVGAVADAGAGLVVRACIAGRRGGARGGIGGRLEPRNAVGERREAGSLALRSGCLLLLLLLLLLRRGLGNRRLDLSGGGGGRCGGRGLLHERLPHAWLRRGDGGGEAICTAVGGV